MKDENQQFCIFLTVTACLGVLIYIALGVSTLVSHSTHAMRDHAEVCGEE